MMKCRCVENGTVDIIGLCDPAKMETPLVIPVSDSEISIPEILTIPCEKPCVESIDKVFVDVKIISKRVIKTPAAKTMENEEGTKLTGSKLVVEGLLCQKIVYTADLPEQSVHSAHFKIPFSVFIMLPFGTDVDKDKFCVDVCVEDVYVKQINCKQIFKNVTLFLRATPLPVCVIEETEDPVVNPVANGATTVTGTAELGAAITVTLPDSTEIVGTANGNGDWSVTVPTLLEGNQISVTAKVLGKLISNSVEVTVTA